MADRVNLIRELYFGNSVSNPANDCPSLTELEVSCVSKYRAKWVAIGTKTVTLYRGRYSVGVGVSDNLIADPC